MKVAIVHDFLVRFGGAEKLVQTLSKMFPEAPIFTLFYDEKKMGKHFKNKKIKTSSLQKLFNLSFGKYTHLLPFMPKAIEEFDFSDYDLVISSSAAFSHGIITTPETKHICYTHAPMRWARDYFFKYPKEKGFSKIKKYFFGKLLHKIREWDFISASRPDIILAASEEVQSRIKKFWRRDSKVAYPFVEIEKFIQIKNPSKDYYLVVSQLVPYKKIDQIIEAFNQFSSHSNKGKKLIIVGEGPERKKLEKLANSNIEFVGAKYGKELIGFYQNAKAFIFAGIDDFGMTPIEAMSCGVPVIAINKGGAKETVIEGKTGFFFEKQSSDSILNCLKNSNLEKINSKNCIKRAEKFSKEKFIENILETIKSLEEKK